MDAAYIGRHVVFGNHKLPETTAIWNCGAAHDCPSRPLGLCQAGKRCYALNTERYQTNSLPYRRRQREIMSTVPGVDIGRAILQRCQGREIKVTLLRFGQSGDIEDQRDVQTLADLCQVLDTAGIRCYGFTARTDLDLRPLIRIAQVNVSNDKGDWTTKGANRFRIVPEPTNNHWVCPKDCTICNKCSTLRGQVIETTRDWKAQMNFNDYGDQYLEEWE